MAYLAQAPDHRCAQGRRHSLSSILAMLVVGMLCGAEGYGATADWIRKSELWFKRRLGFGKHGTPAPSTIHAAIRHIDLEAVAQAVYAWTAQATDGSDTLKSSADDRPVGLGRAIALDGKVLRGSLKEASPLFRLLEVALHDESVVLGSEVVGGCPLGGRGETSAAPQVIEKVLRAGDVVTMDAGFTHRGLASLIHTAGGYYIQVIKGNQPKLLAAAKELHGLAGAPGSARRSHSEHEKKHGRVSERLCITISTSEDEIAWPGARQVIRIHRKRWVMKANRDSSMIVYAVTNLPTHLAGPACLQLLIKQHWTIENKVFWVKDTQLREDASRVRCGSIPMVMAILRSLMMNLLRLAGHKSIAAGRRAMAANKRRSLRLVGA